MKFYIPLNMQDIIPPEEGVVALTTSTTKDMDDSEDKRSPKPE
jgi:hypothetical protein